MKPKRLDPDYYRRMRRAIETVFSRAKIVAPEKVIRDLAGAASINTVIALRANGPVGDRKTHRRGRLKLRAAREQHAIDRARERYGLAVTPADLQGLVDRVEAGEGVRVTDGRSRVCIELRGKLLVIVYSKIKREIVTFLPPEEFERVKSSGTR